MYRRLGAALVQALSAAGILGRQVWQGCLALAASILAVQAL